MAVYGERVTAATGTYGVILHTERNQRGQSFGPMPVNGWLRRLSLWCGSGGPLSGTNPIVRYAVWRGDGTGLPGTRLGYTGPVAVATSMAGGVGGADIVSEMLVTNRTFSPANNAVMLRQSDRYFLGVQVLENNLPHALIDATGEQHYRYVGTPPPADPFDRFGALGYGTMAVWGDYQENRLPDTPSAPLPLNGSTIATTTPVFRFGSGDPDAADGDRMARFTIEVRRVGQEAFVWRPTEETTPAEQLDWRTDRPYAGTALIAGVSYQWRARTYDLFDEPSPWSPWWSFAINAGGTVTLDGDPQGKVLDPAGLTYQGRWSHPAALFANRLQVRLKQNGTVVRVGDEVPRAPSIASSAAPGTLFAVAAPGVGTLANGVDYEYEIRARDSLLEWSPWSAPRAFRTNAAPFVPSNLQPPNGTASSTRPLLSFAATDPDDDPAGTLTAQVRVKDAAGAVRLGFPKAAVWNAALSQWEYQVIPADLAGFGTYKWDARGRDGTLDSAWSIDQSFVFGAGPVVVVTSPGAHAAIQTTAPVVTWTATGQTAYRVRIYNQGGGLPIYGTGDVASVAREHLIPPGVLRNGRAYDLIVDSLDAFDQRGVSLRRPFRVAYTASDPLDGFLATPVAVRGDASATAIELTWPRSRYSPGGWEEYVIRRRELGDDEAASIVLVRIGNIAQTRWVDFFPASGVTYRYTIIQITRNGIDRVESYETVQDAGVTLRNVLIVSTRQGLQDRVSLNWRKSRSQRRGTNVTFLPTWGGGAPFGLTGTDTTNAIEATYVLRDVANGPTAREQMRALERMVAHVDEREGVLAGGDPVCYRDERGRRLFGVITNLDADDGEPSARADEYEVTLTIQAVAYREGAEV